MKHENLKAKYAHSLIGRSILIRYLEDRGILVNKYFRKVASANPRWERILDTPPDGHFADPDLAQRLYFRVLKCKDFTYALFTELARDFNGDMFPEDEDEQNDVSQEHLNLLQAFLCGTAVHPQLFFFAYKFDIIPIELISSIYEEFYHTENTNQGDSGTHYTRPCLVEFILSQVLTQERLADNPTILDLACGSGIFLVEAFRRIVRYRSQKQKSRLNWSQLKKIIRNQIVGIEINEEALRVAVFSLYLAFMHYLEPKDILEHIGKGRRLPSLILQKEVMDDDDHFNNMLAANSFDIESKINKEDDRSRFRQACADVVVGNPPWGKYKSIGYEAKKIEEWCISQNKAVGNKELAQAFIHLSLHMLKNGGIAGLLVPTAGTFLNQAKTSKTFRRQLLNSAILRQVINFDHVRDIFFHDAIAPFSIIVFQKGEVGREELYLNYWSAKKTKAATQLRVVFLNKADLRLIRHEKLADDDILWKIYWWGNHRDEALINALKLETPLLSAKDDAGRLIVDSGRGITVGNRSKPVDFLKQFQKMLLTERFERYGQISDNDFESIPDRVECPRWPELFQGKRILFKQSPSSCYGRYGYIIARLENENLCFRHSIYSLRLRDSVDWQAKVLLGIFWSSLARYYFFMTACSWGSWHHKISLDEVRKFPVRFPTNKDLRDRIVKLVEQLQRKSPRADSDWFGSGNSLSEVNKLENDLDQAIFDLYGFSSAERDQVMDMCEYGLDLFYKHVQSYAFKPVEQNRPPKCRGVCNDIPSGRTVQKGLEGYLRAFLEIWNRELEPDGEFRWEIVRPGAKIPMLAVIFATQEKNEAVPDAVVSDIDEWGKVLSRLDKSLVTPFSCKRIYVDGVVRTVSDTEIMLIKRNERRLWTNSVAREDAEATLLQAVHLQEAKGRA